MKHQELSKQQKYKLSMAKLNFKPVGVMAHIDDRVKIQKFAQKLREKRGYDGQPKTQ